MNLPVGLRPLSASDLNLTRLDNHTQLRAFVSTQLENLNQVRDNDAVDKALAPFVDQLKTETNLILQSLNLDQENIPGSGFNILFCL